MRDLKPIAKKHIPGFSLKKSAFGYFRFYNVHCSDVLVSARQYKDSVRSTLAAALPVHPDAPKNWDSLAALLIFLKYCRNKSARILDAGGEYYSVLLLQLSLLGYKNLVCINLSFTENVVERGIFFQPGDLTNTTYQDGYFNAIACLSVIEHGVEIHGYFKEMSRILKKGGILFTSADYWDKHIDAGDRKLYGVPVRIFDSEDVLQIVQIAPHYGFKLIEPLHLKCAERVVNCDGLAYTFIYFALRKI